MPFISYSQNFEDVMLWRALKHIKKGFYVDVGAQHPVVDSVSKAFYENGWNGINIEPVPFYADLLRKDRPRDSVLEVAVSNVEGTLELNIIPETGLSTAIEGYAQRHKIERGYTIQKIKVPVTTLKQVSNLLVSKDIHWLKIDVEGLEEKVLKGWDSRTLRPWIIVVEATVPNSPELDYKSWDGILTSADYQFVYFDGLNRFYVSNEHADLKKAFFCPPNAFDDFVMFSIVERDSRLFALEKKNNLKEDEVNLIKNKLDSQNIKYIALSEELDKTKTELDSVTEELRVNKGQLITANNEFKLAKNQLDSQNIKYIALSEELDKTKTELDSVTEELRVNKGQLITVINEFKLAKKQLDSTNAELSSVKGILLSSESQLGIRLNELKQIYSCRAWRIIVSLRKVYVAVLPYGSIRRKIFRIVWKAIRHPSEFFIKIVRKIKKTFEYSVGIFDKRNNKIAQLPTSEYLNNLSPRARKIYAELKTAIENRKKNK